MNASPSPSIALFHRRERLGRRAGAAFTLLELLVAVAILAVILGLLLPVFGRLRATAAKANCISNLRSLASGLLAYGTEHRRLPWGFYDDKEPPPGTRKKTYWGGELYTGGYIGSCDTFFCNEIHPRFWRESSFRQGFKTVGASSWAYVSYAVNSYGLMPGWSQGNATDTQPAALVSIQNPAQTVMLVEVSTVKDPKDGSYWITSGGASGAVETILRGEKPGGTCLTGRHNNQAPVAFADGHVESVSRTDSNVVNFPNSKGTPWYEFIYTRK